MKGMMKDSGMMMNREDEHKSDKKQGVILRTTHSSLSIEPSLRRALSVIVRSTAIVPATRDFVSFLYTKCCYIVYNQHRYCGLYMCIRPFTTGCSERLKITQINQLQKRSWIN